MSTVWDDVLTRIRQAVEAEDFRRWFATTAYASDSGDQITVWVESEAIRRHLAIHYEEEIAAALAALGRRDTHIRFLVAGFDDEDDADDEAQ